MQSLGGVIVVIGSFLPWATVATGLGSASVAGTDGDGKITLAIGAVIAILALLEVMDADVPFGWLMATPRLILFASLGAGAVGIYDLTKVNERLSGVNTSLVHASIGIGLYAVILGAGVALVGSLLRRD